MTATDPRGARRVLVTGANGYIGRLTVEALAADPRALERIVALDVRETPEAARRPGVVYLQGDVRGEAVVNACREHAVDTVVHLASIVTPGKDSNRELEYSVDVLGTKNVLEACVATKARKLIVTSSGAAYGYHADNPEWLDEDDPLRGNESFPYAHHKRLVEEMLAEARRKHPELAQLIFRPGTILGEAVSNQITNLFEKPVILGIRGASTPFVLIWDRDVVACIARGVHGPETGIYNLAGDGVLTLREIAALLGKRYIEIPAGALAGALRVLKPLGLTRYGPEQVDFLRYRPVLANKRLKDGFGFTPRMTTREVFDLYRGARRGDG